MVQVLPYVPSFGEKLAATLGQATGTIGEGLAKRRENQQVQNTVGILQDPSKSPIEKITAFMQLPEHVKKSSAPIWAAVLGPQAQADAELDQLRRFREGNLGAAPAQGGAQQQVQPMQAQPAQMGQEPAQVQAAQQGQAPLNTQDLTTWPDEAINEMAALSGFVGRLAKGEQERRVSLKKERTAKEKEYFKKNEPELIKIADHLQNLDIEDTRFARLEKLFQEGKFPSAFTSALFSKDGQLRPLAASFVSPEAQEAIKLIQDNLSGAKDTFGARVTNFDVANYLKRLPSLLNTPEGRQRVLRDLRSINQINRLYDEGILEIFDERGGSDKISYSGAERIFKKKYKKELDALREEFINPSKKNFDAKPDASKYMGQKIEDTETGEVFISDGKEWKPVQAK